MKVAILLTTWNSSRYLDELMDSLLAQTYEEWDLWVRDDGSSDNTQYIINKYALHDRRIHVMESKGNLGPKKSFMWMLSRVDADMYMFCDHDDVWLPTKVEDSVKLMLKQPDWQDVPLVVGTDLRVVDARLNTLAESFWALHHFPLSFCNDKYFHLSYNNIPGCTMLFNNAARLLALPCPEDVSMHDNWVILCVLWHNGRVLPLKKPTILYRQHSHNVLGSKEVPSYLSQIKHFRSLWGKARKEWQGVRAQIHISFCHFLLIKLYYMMRLHAHI